jgi:hypothetical protein
MVKVWDVIGPNMREFFLELEQDKSVIDVKVWEGLIVSIWEAQMVIDEILYNRPHSTPALSDDLMLLRICSSSILNLHMETIAKGPVAHGKGAGTHN